MIITGILDNAGNYVVKYRYKAWGTATQVISQGCEELDVLYNPFRFKGYFYDEETGFYYLKTRYYAPIIGKFISMDSINYMDIKSLNGVNLYAYCNNNPVMHADPCGQFTLTLLSLSLLMIRAGLVLLGAFALVCNINQHSNGLTDDGFIGRDNFFDELSNWLQDIKRSIAFFITFGAIIDKYPGQYEEDHIVPLRDRRGDFARYIYEELCGFNIDNPVNKVYIKKVYHKLLHTNLYYTILDISLAIAYARQGSLGVLVVLGVFKSYLGGL